MHNESDQTDKLRVVVVEDSAELRGLLVGMLDEISGVDIVGFADSERGAIDTLQSTLPDLAIVDLELTTGNGLNVLKTCAEPSSPLSAVKTIVFSNYANKVIRTRCRTLGACAFFDKSFQMDELLDFVQEEASTQGQRSKPVS